jgi:Glucodextranase, domain B/PASTA domain
MLAACASSTTPAPPPLKLRVSSPADGGGTLEPEVRVRGSVGPGAARVLVAGKPVAVRRGSFTALVPVAAGTNVIDVLAGAPRAADAMTIVRVYRQLPVAVPQVAGQDPDVAARQLSQAGLRPRLQGGGGFFQSLLPFVSKQVCSTDPRAGSLLSPGSAVTLRIARFC